MSFARSIGILLKARGRTELIIDLPDRLRFEREDFIALFPSRLRTKVASRSANQIIRAARPMLTVTRPC